MRRNCRAVLAFRNQCSCRHMSAAAAAQLKPKQLVTAGLSPDLPSPKTWSRPPQLQPSSPTVLLEPPKRKDWSRPSTITVHPSPKEFPSSQQTSQTNSSPPSLDAPIIKSRPSNHIPAPKQWGLAPKAASILPNTTFTPPKATFPPLVESTASTPSASSLSTSPALNKDLNSQSSRERPTQSTKSPNLYSNDLHAQPTKPTLNWQDSQRPTKYQSTSKITERQRHSIKNKPSVLKAQLKQKIQRKRGRRRDVFIPSTLTVATLASVLKIKLEYLLSRMKRIGMLEEARYDYILNSDYASLLADELGFNSVVDDEAAFDIHPPPPHPNPSSLPSRPPIVTIMGHVDHGKTTLLDTLRSASVAKGEAGGITQHIGAFSVPVKSGQGENSTSGPQTITFLDTPGHAAFSAMRARGADVTDIIVLVVAADDGIMPQTKEVINILKKEEAQMNLVVAINKVDKPGVNTDAVKKALMAEGIQLEEFGGDIPAVHVSGLTGQGLPELVETLSAVAEMQDLRAEDDGPVFGHVLESNLHKGLGPVATVLVQRGCLKRGSPIISGLSHGKVRLMTNSKGASVQKVLPGMAVTVSGWKTLPKAGDEVLDGSDADIKKALSNRIRKAEANAMQQEIEAINTTRGQEHDARGEGATVTTATEEPVGPKQFKLYIKADVSGSGEALEGALNGMGNHVAISKVIGSGVGDVTESDVMRAHAAKATIIGFSVSVPRAIRNLAAQNAVPIFTSDIIYRLIDDVRGSLVSMLPTIKETKVIGEANVLEVFDIQLKGGKTMKVAGCRVTNGIIEKQKSVRVVRSGEIVYEGSLDTMRQLKKDITEARKGVECGMSLKDFSDLQSDDLIQMFETIEKPGVL